MSMYVIDCLDKLISLDMRLPVDLTLLSWVSHLTDGTGCVCETLVGAPCNMRPVFSRCPFIQVHIETLKRCAIDPE